MATALQVIERALRDLKVYAAGESVSTADRDECLQVLNEMMAEWGITGIDLAHIDLAYTDTIDVPNNHLNAIRRNLGVRIAPMFGAEITPLDIRLAELGAQAVRAYHFTIADLRDDNPLARNNQANS